MAERLLDAVADAQHPALQIIAAERGRVKLHLPFEDAFVGNPWTGYIHGGVLSTLLDKVTRAAALSRLASTETVMPLDLRVDHLCATRGAQGLTARAHCYRLSETIAFVEGDVRDAASGVVVASGVSSLLRQTLYGEGA